MEEKNLKNVDPNATVPVYVLEAQMIPLIDEWCFVERDRAILKRRFLDGICFEPLAEEFDLSVRQVKRIVDKQGARVLKHYP